MDEEDRTFDAVVTIIEQAIWNGNVSLEIAVAAASRLHEAGLLSHWVEAPVRTDRDSSGPARCPTCGRFARSSAFTGEGGGEMISITCKTHGRVYEGGY